MSPAFDTMVFDLGGVIVAHDNAMLYARLATRCAVRCSPDQINAAINRTEWGSGVAPISDLHAQLQRDFSYRGSWEVFVEDWSSHFTLDQSMLALVRQLKISNRVMLFSNTNREHWEFLVNCSAGALGSMENYLSYQIGLSKPSVDAFRCVAARAEIDPSRCILFDDLAENVEGARLAGFQAEVFQDEAWLRHYLKAAGLPLSDTPP